MHLRLHACTQSCSPLINGLVVVDDVLQHAPVMLLVTWKMRHFCHFTSEQNKK